MLNKIEQIIVDRILRKAISFLLPVVTLVVFSVGFIFLAIQSVNAAPGIRQTINFQGKLVDDEGLNVADSSYTVVFTLYNASSGGSQLWQESRSVTTSDGIFREELGTTTSLSTVDFNNDSIYLGIKVGADAEMTPRVRFTATPYAFQAQNVPWSGLKDAAANLAVSMGSYTSTFTYGNSTGANDLFKLTDTTSNTGTGRVLSVQSASGSTVKPFHVSAGGVEAILVDANGNIGIGTTNPTRKLDVNGTFRLRGQLYDYNNEVGTPGQVLSTSATGVDWIDASGVGTDNQTLANVYSQAGNDVQLTGAYGDIRFYRGTTTEMLFLDESSGNVGIGTTNPTYKLSVNGDVEIVNGSELYSFGSATLGNRTYTTPTYVASGQTFTASIQALDNAVEGVVSGSGGVWTRNIGSGYLFPATLSDSVGIGTSTPTAKLQVVGNIVGSTLSDGTISITNGIIAGVTTISVADGSQSAPSYTFSNDSNTGFYRPATDSVGVGTSGVERIRISPNGNVGIGTTNPTYKLDVTGDIRIANGSELYSFGSATLGNRTYTTPTYVASGQTFTASIQALDDAVEGVVSGSGGVWSRDSGGGYLFPQTLTDSVGIGTSTPTAKLQVVGNIVGSTLSDGILSITAGNITGAGNITAGGIITGTGSGLTGLNASNLASGTVPSGRVSGNYSGITGVGTITSGTWQGSVISSLYLDPAVILSSEIDTYAELDAIVSDVTLTHNGLIDTSSEIAAIVGDETGSGALVFANTPTFAGNVYFPGSGVWNSSGNVGIGTTNPLYDLDVNGDIRIANGSELYSFGSATLGNRTYTTPTYVASGQTFTASIQALDDAVEGVVSGSGGVWSRNAGLGYLYPQTLSDSVGIGTSTPSEKLHVIGNAIISGNITSGGIITGTGSGLTGLNASNLASGTVPSGRVSGNYSGITGVGTITSGTWQGSVISSAYLDSAVILSSEIDTYAELDAIVSDVTLTHNGLIDTSSEIAGIVGDETGTGSLVFSNSPALVTPNIGAATGTSLNVTGAITAGGIITGTGSGLTHLNASNLTTGTVPDARIAGAYTNFTNITGSGNSQFANFRAGNGARTTPSYSFTSDTNTGMYRIGTDILSFSTAGSDRFTILAGGNVGIGTTNPTYKLSVNGDVEIVNGSELYSFGSATLGNRTYTTPTYVASGQTFTASIQALDNAVEGVVSGSGGVWTRNIGSGYLFPATLSDSVGIGTSTPTAKLQVVGNIVGSTLSDGILSITGGNITGAGNITSGGIITGTGSGLTGLNASNLASGTVPSGRISGNYSGITGVGTITSGTWQGSVISSAYLDSAVILSSEIDTYSELNTIVADVTLTHNGLIDTYTELNTIVADVTLTHNGLIDTYTELNTIVSDVTLTHNGLIDTSLEIAGIVGDETGSGALVFANSPVLVTPNIGAATGTSLNVTGAITAGGIITGTGSGLTALNASNLTTGTVPDGRITGAYTGFTNITGSGTVQFGNFRADNGSVSTPAYSFTSDTNMGMYRIGTDILSLATAGADRFTILAGGNVGVGTTNPGAKLEVNGQVKITGGSPGTNKVLTSDSSGLATWQTLGAASIGDDSLDFDKFKDVMTLDADTSVDQNGYDFGFFGTGNVGIGTSTPSQQLEVAGNALFTTNIYVGTTDVQLSRGAANRLDLATGDSFNIVSGNLQIAGTTAIDSSRNANFATSVTLGADVVASRGAANRLDLASGDSLNLVSGDLQVGGTTAIDSSRNANFATSVTLGADVVASRGAANRLDLASGDSLNLVSGDLQVGGTSVITSGRLVQTANGSRTAPAYSFSADTNTGMYRIGTDILGLATAGADRLTILANGSVGIGRTNPTFKLDVAGGSRVSALNVGSRYYSDNIYNYSNGILIATDIATSDNRMIEFVVEGNSYSSSGPIETKIQAYNYTGSGTIIQTSGITEGPSFDVDIFHYGGYVYFWLQQSSSFQTMRFQLRTHSGNHTITAITNAVKPVSGVTNSVTITPMKAWYAGNDGASSGLDADLFDTFDSTQFLRSDASDNYTSGTLAFNGGTTLDVNGDLTIADTSIAFDGASTNFATTGNFSINTNQLFINQSTGNLGIGTASPLAVDGGSGTRLHIDNGTGTGNVEVARFEGGSDADNTYGVVRIGHANDRGLFIKGGRQTGDVPIAMLGLTSAAGAMTDMMTFFAGNIGIGTTNPGAKLEVAGQVKITGGSPGTNKVLTSDSSGLATWQTLGAASIADDSLDFDKFKDVMTLDADTSVDQNGYDFSFFNTGNVGIGTSTPNHKLDVSGNGLITGNVYVGTTDVQLSRGAANRLDLATGDSFNIVSGNLQVAGTTAIDSSRNANFATSVTLGADVVASRGAANRLDLASGDSLNLVSGDVQVGGTSVITSGRLVQTANGSRTAPAYSFSADTNTGMYRIGTDILSLATAGSDRLTVLANGNTGIGTTSPAVPLDVRGNARFGTGSVASAPDTYVSVSNATVGQTVGFLVYNTAGSKNQRGWFQMNDSTNMLEIGMTYGTSSPGMTFSTGGNVERMRIESGGDVGIGTTNPAHKLDVSGNGLITGNVYVGTTDVQLSRGAANRLDLATGDSFNIVSGNLQIAGTTAIDSSRNANFATSVTLGADVVASRGAANRLDLASGDSLNLVSGDLQVGGTSVITSGRLVQTANGSRTAPAYSFSADTNTGMYRIGTDILGLATAGADRLTILANGSVGIGTTAPSYKLQVQGNGAGLTFMPDATNQVDSSNIRFMENTTSGFRMQYDGTLDGLRFKDQGTDLDIAFFGRNGEVGIGTTNPGAALEIGGQVKITGGSPGENKVLVSDSSGLASWTTIGEASITNDSLDFDKFRDNMTLDATTTVAMAGYNFGFHGTGNVGIGTSDPSQKLEVAGNALFTTNIYVGTTDVQLSRGAANRLDLASGDALNIVSGNLQMGATTMITSGRLVQAANGSGTAPAYSFSADTNTGMYRIGTDILSLATAGSDRLTILANGRVGIGTTTPGAPLEVNGAARIGYDSNTTSYIGRAAVGYGASYSDYAYFGHLDLSGAAGNYALLQSAAGETFLNASTGQPINFRINNSTMGQLEADGDWAFDTNTLFVDASANSVGIGIATPETALHVEGDITIGGTNLYFEDSTSGGSASLIRTVHFNNNDFLEFDDTLNRFRFTGDGSDYMAIDDGKVGIGTTVPGSLLHLGAQGGLRLTNSELANVTDTAGEIYFDENYYSSGEAGYPYFNGNGGGLAIKNEDGWGAVLSTANMQYAWMNLDRLHIGGTSDPGTNNLLVDGTITSTGTITSGGAEVSTFKTNTASVTDGWYRIASDGPTSDGGTGGDTAYGRFVVWSYESGRHCQAEFTAGYDYSASATSPTVVLNSNNCYNGTDTPITAVRAVAGGTYEGGAVEVYIDVTTSASVGYQIYDEANASPASNGNGAWTPVDWTAGSVWTGASATTVNIASTDAIIGMAAGTGATDEYYINRAGSGVFGGSVTTSGDILNTAANGQLGASANFVFRDTGDSWLRLRTASGGSTYADMALGNIYTSGDISNVGTLSFSSGANHRITSNTSGLLFDGGDGTYDFLVYDDIVYSDELRLGYNGSALLTTYDTNENLVIDPNGTGLVAIGNGFTPTADLHIGGGTTTSDGTPNIPGVQIAGGTGGWGKLELTGGAANTAGHIDFIRYEELGSDFTSRIIQRSGSLNFATTAETNFSIRNSNGYVGVGTTSPTQPLTVSGNALVTGTILGGNSTDTTNRLMSLLTTMANGTYKYVTFGEAASTYNQAELSFYSAAAGSTNNRLNLGFYGLQVMSIEATGMVGIGTQDPSSALDVIGDIELSGSIADSTDGIVNISDSLQTSGNLYVAANGYLDDDTTAGGLTDDWIKFSGYIEMRSNTDNYGIVLRDSDTTSYMGMTQVGGVSYLADSNTYSNYFLSGNGANGTFRGHMYVGGGTSYYFSSAGLVNAAHLRATTYLQVGSTTDRGLYFDQGDNDLHIGGINTQDGNIFVKDYNGVARIQLNTDAFAGTGHISTTTLTTTGDIIGNRLKTNLATNNNIGVCHVIDGSHRLLVDCSSAPTDLAENFSAVDTTIEPGDLVVADGQAEVIPEPNTPGKITSKAAIKKTSGKYDDDLLGIISTDPNQLYGDDGVFDPSENPVPVSLAGRVPTKVSLENGPIRTGDYITSSSTPGIGMKATRAGRVVGMALQDFTGGSGNNQYGKIVVFVNPTWYDPSTKLNAAGNLSVTGQNGLYSLTNTANNTTFDNSYAAKEMIAAYIKTGRVSTTDLSVAGKAEFTSLEVTNFKLAGKTLSQYIEDSVATGQVFTSIDEQLDTQETQIAQLDLESNILSTSVASQSASLTSVASRIDQLEQATNDTEAVITSLQDRIASLETMFANNMSTSSAMLFTDSPSATVSANIARAITDTEVIFDKKLIAEDDLTVLGKLNTSDIGVTGTITSGLLTINGFNDEMATPSATISTFGGILSLQHDGMNGIDFVAGKVAIDVNGNVLVREGDVEIENGNLVLRKGSIKGSDSIRGIDVSVTAGATELSVTFTDINDTDAYAISVLPTWFTNVVVQEKTIDGFKILFDRPAPVDATVDWLIVE